MTRVGGGKKGNGFVPRLRIVNHTVEHAGFVHPKCYEVICLDCLICAIVARQRIEKEYGWLLKGWTRVQNEVLWYELLISRLDIGNGEDKTSARASKPNPEAGPFILVDRGYR